MAPPPELHTWLPWSELSATKPVTVGEFQSVISKFPRSALLVACARLSILFKYGPDANTVASNETVEKLASQMFPPVLVPRVLTALKQGRVIFFQGQLRYLAAETMRLTNPHPEDGMTVPDMVLGGILLAAGELLYKPHINNLPDDLDVMANLVADFLPLYEIDSITDPFMPLLRFYIYLTEIIPNLPPNISNQFNLEEEFQKVFGFQLKLYYQFVYTFTIHAMNERNDEPAGVPPADGGLPLTWFKKTVLTTEQVEAMFKTVCCRLEDLPDTKKAIGYADFEFLKNHPYFLTNDQIYAIDYEYASAKLESGILWRVAMSMNEKRRLTYFGYWGEVFERYVHWLFGTYIDKKHNAYYPSPVYIGGKDNKPICDGIMMCGSTAVLMEIKLGTVAVKTKYSGEHALFTKFIEDKLVEGTDRPIGVSQLYRAIEQITTGPAEAFPLWLRCVKKIIPLIITKDDIGSSWMINAYLNARFQQKLVTINKKARKKCKITPLVCMNVATLERCVHILNKAPFSDVLENRIHEDRILGRPFDMASTMVDRGTPHEVYEHIKIMEKLSAEVKKDFNLVE